MRMGTPVEGCYSFENIEAPKALFLDILKMRFECPV